jgi:hypothetical protein
VPPLLLLLPPVGVPPLEELLLLLDVGLPPSVGTVPPSGAKPSVRDPAVLTHATHTDAAAESPANDQPSLPTFVVAICPNDRLRL